MKRSTLFDIAFVVALAACSLYLGHLATVAYLRHVADALLARLDEKRSEEQ